MFYWRPFVLRRPIILVRSPGPLGHHATVWDVVSFPDYRRRTHQSGMRLEVGVVNKDSGFIFDCTFRSQPFEKNVSAKRVLTDTIIEFPGRIEMYV